ncbi:MAG: RNA polymerase sigma factor [Oscillospiraceae bacterium]
MEQDKELYRRFVNGDIQAFEELVLTHKDNLIYFLTRYVKDVHTCEDIAQEVFATIFVKKENYNYKVSVKTYLYAIAKNKATDYIRKFSRIESLNEEEKNTDDDELFNRVVKNEEQRLVHNAIRKLKLEYQRVLLLIDIDGLSYKEAGNVMQKTLPQIKILIFRARNALKNLLVKEGYTNEN